MDADRTIEIFDISGDSAANLALLVHVEPYPDDEESYRAAVVFWSAGVLSLEYVLNTWSRSFWRSPKGTIYVAGLDGAVRSNPGGRWTTQMLGSRFTLSSIWGFSDELMYCSAFNANFFRRRNFVWEDFAAGLHGDLFGIGGTAPDDLYVLGEAGELFHHDSQAWSAVQSPTNKRLVGLLPVSADEVYFCGWHGAFFRLIHGEWQDLSLKTPTNLYRIASYQDRLYVAGAANGVFRLEGVQLVPFADSVMASGVRVIGDRLIAFGGTVLQMYDGKTWSRFDLALDSVIPATLP
jgi:hypothetical protein